MTTGLQQQTKLRQTLAPQMRQGVKLLAMSLPELRAELLAEMAKNPVIDDVEPTLEKTTISQKERESAAETRVDDYPDDDFDARDTARPDAEALERRQKFFENQTAEETLEHHLTMQLPTSGIDEADLPLAEMLIGELDDAGRFVGSMPDIVMISGESEEKVRSVLAKIRELDPPGCGATTIRECLEAQLDKIEDAGLRARVAKLLANLEDVAAGKVDDMEALRALRTLEPRPGRAYLTSPRGTEYINPEVHVVQEDGRWTAYVDARSLPEIRISPKYVRMLQDPACTPETKAYIRERIAAANAVVEAVEKRQETIVNVAQEIFDRQPGFFESGLKGLKPMTMREIAEKVGVSESTVSRTVNGKYTSTPKGTVELARFFARGVKTESGEEVSRDGVLDRLREIVDGEDKAHPLADEKLALLLKAEGFPVARRTVAKYRGLAGIPGTSERRKG